MPKPKPKRGLVEVYLDGERQGDPIFMFPGDQVLYCMTGDKLHLTTAEEQVKALQQEVFGQRLVIGRLRELIEDMSKANSLDEAIGMAWRKGELREDF